MDKNLIAKTLTQIESLHENSFQIEDSPMDNLDMVKSALERLSLDYKTSSDKKRDYIHIYYKNKLLSKYSKANYPNNKFLGRSICNDKFKTEFYLSLNNVPTPKSKLFLEKDYRKAMNFIQDIPVPFVIKALDLRQGVGVFTDVTHENFEKYWLESFKIQHKRKNPDPKVIIQNQLDGLEIRINVTEGVVESAILRLHGFIIGDGEHSVEDLINIKNTQKKRNPYLNRDMIVIEDEINKTLRDAKLNNESILEEGEMLILSKKPEIRYGMETYNVTEFLHKNILDIGLNAVLAIPGLHTAGVDIIIPELNSEIGHVIEVNKNPAWALSLYTVKGQTGKPLDDIFKSHNLDYRLLNNEINRKEDIDEEEFKMIIKRFKFLFEKDQYNRQNISHYHKGN